MTETEIIETNDLGWAVQHMKSGGKVTRLGWNGKGQYLYLMPESEQVVKGKVIKRAPQVFIHPVKGDDIGWLCSASDLLAEDFVTYQE